MEILSVVGVAVISAALCVLLKQYRPEYALAVGLISSALLFMGILLALSPAFSFLTRLLEKTHTGNRYVTSLLKALGICYLVQFASDSCKDAGQAALASKVELAGKGAVLLLALPLFENLLSTAAKLMEW